MRQYPSDIAFTPAVKGIQTAKGSRTSYAKVERRSWLTRVTPDLTEFLAGLDMFYLGTASAEGQPYIQHRGGSPGFLKVLDDKTLAFADFEGNRQFITLGNLSENPKAFIFLMDYANQHRVKLWGTARVVEADARPFFGGLQRERTWVFWRRVLHPCPHRTQVQSWLRLAGHEPVPAIYGPSGDVMWDEADPTYSLEAAKRDG